MLITRLGSDREVEKEVGMITIELDGFAYRISENSESKLEINKIDLSDNFDNTICVFPKVTNVIEIK